MCVDGMIIQRCCVSCGGLDVYDVFNVVLYDIVVAILRFITSFSTPLSTPMQNGKMDTSWYPLTKRA